jgi:hypothetical protein
MRTHPEALYFHIARSALADIEHETDELDNFADRYGKAS